MEDTRHRIGLLQFNLSTDQTQRYNLYARRLKLFFEFEGFLFTKVFMKMHDKGTEDHPGGSLGRSMYGDRSMLLFKNKKNYILHS